jgi:hypothetical protein
MIANGMITNYADFLALFPERPRTQAGDGWSSITDDLLAVLFFSAQNDETHGVVFIGDDG